MNEQNMTDAEIIEWGLAQSGLVKALAEIADRLQYPNQVLDSEAKKHERIQ